MHIAFPTPLGKQMSASVKTRDKTPRHAPKRECDETGGRFVIRSSRRDDGGAAPTCRRHSSMIAGRLIPQLRETPPDNDIQRFPLHALRAMSPPPTDGDGISLRLALANQPKRHRKCLGINKSQCLRGTATGSASPGYPTEANAASRQGAVPAQWAAFQRVVTLGNGNPTEATVKQAVEEALKAARPVKKIQRDTTGYPIPEEIRDASSVRSDPGRNARRY